MRWLTDDDITGRERAFLKRLATEIREVGTMYAVLQTEGP